MFVPLAQALITAALVTLLCGVLAVIAGRDDALRIVGVAFVVTLCAAWAWRLGIVTSLLQTVERITEELDGDDAPDDAETHLMAVQADAARQSVATETRQRTADARLLWLIAFVARCYTVGTSESAQGIKPGEGRSIWRRETCYSGSAWLSGATNTISGSVG